MPRVLIFLYIVTALACGASLWECNHNNMALAPLYAFLAMNFCFASTFITIVWLICSMNEPRRPY